MERHDGFAGNDAVLARCGREFARWPSECDAVGVDGDEPSQAAFGRIREFVPIALESSPATTIVKMACCREQMNSSAVSAAKHAASDHRLRWAAIASRVGVIYMALLPESAR